jgi:oligopeptidase B
VYRHKLGTDPSEDVLIFHEKDDTFDVNVFKTKSLQYIFIASSSTISDEHILFLLTMFLQTGNYSAKNR